MFRKFYKVLLRCLMRRPRGAFGAMSNPEGEPELFLENHVKFRRDRLGTCLLRSVLVGSYLALIAFLYYQVTGQFVDLEGIVGGLSSPPDIPGVITSPSGD